MTQSALRKFLAAAVMLALCPLVLAQTERASSGGNTQMLRQMQQLASERTQLQAENAKLKQELAVLKKERDAFKGGSDSADRKLRALQASAARADEQRAASSQELTSQRARMDELVSKFRETAGTLREVEAQRATAVQSLATRDIELAQCGDRNQKLYALNDEVLTYFGKRGFWSGLASAEPFTQLKKVQLENLIGEYRAKAEDQSMVKTTP
jgi:chromosome segregation ATPase